MFNNKTKILERQLLLMGYRLDNTLSENADQLKKKQIVFEQGAADRYTDYINSEKGQEQIKREEEQKIANTYPNYCWNKGEGTVLPGENKYGVSGVEAIPVSSAGTKFCAYRGIGNTLIFLPSEGNGIENIVFHNGTIAEYNYQVENMIKRGKLLPHDEQNYINFISGVAGYLPNTKTIWSFKIFDEKYTSYIKIINSGIQRPDKIDYDQSGVAGDSWDDIPKLFEPGGYKTDNNKYWVNPKWEDPRSTYEYIIDEFGIWIQVAAALVIGYFTAGLGTYAILIELGSELILGGIIAQRDFEKGNNIAGLFSIIFGALPALKLTKYFRGVDEGVFNSLAKKLSGSNLSEASTASDYVKFYRKLNLEEQKLMSQAIKTDKATYDQLINEIVITYGKTKKGAFLSDNLANMLKSDKTLLLNKSFWKNNIGLDIKRMGIVGLAGLFAELGLGHKFNDEQKMFLSGLHSVIPESLELEIALNTFGQNLTPEQQSEIVDNLKNDVEQAIDDAVEFRRNKIIQDSLKIKAQQSVADSLNNLGKTYIELEEDDTNQKDYLADSEESLKNSGYIPYSEKLDSDSIDASAPTKLFNMRVYVKVVKK